MNPRDQAHPIEPDGMTERVEVEQPAWHALVFVLVLFGTLFAIALAGGSTTPVAGL